MRHGSLRSPLLLRLPRCIEVGALLHAEALLALPIETRLYPCVRRADLAPTRTLCRRWGLRFRLRTRGADAGH